MSQSNLVLPEDLVVIGRISGLYGIKGWLKIQSYTAEKKNILDYIAWYANKLDHWIKLEVIKGNEHAKNIIVLFNQYNNRNESEKLIHYDIYVERSAFKPLNEGEYYWADLIGLPVKTENDVFLGRVDHLIETGSNDVLIVKGDKERLIPFIKGQVIKEINIQEIVVDWDPDF